MDFRTLIEEIPEELRSDAKDEAEFDSAHTHSRANTKDTTLVTMMVMAAAQEVAGRAHKAGRPQHEAACAVLDGLATALGMTLSAFSGPTDHAKRVNGRKAYRIAADMAKRDSDESARMIKLGVQLAHQIARGEWEPPKS